MIASFLIKSFSRVDTRFFESSTVKEDLPLQFETFGSDKPMIAFSSSSNFLSTDFVKSLIASNSFMKKFWKEVELCVVSFSVGLRGLSGACATSNDESGLFRLSRNIADVSSGNFCVSGMVKNVICVFFVFLVPSWLCSQLECYLLKSVFLLFNFVCVTN